MWEAAEIIVLLQLVYLILSESEVCGAVKDFFYQVKEKKKLLGFMQKKPHKRSLSLKLYASVTHYLYHPRWY